MMGGEHINIYEGNNGNPNVHDSNNSSRKEFDMSSKHFRKQNKEGENRYKGVHGTNANIAPVEQQHSAESPSISTLKLNGGASSAWRASAYSRGPVNYPNNGWYDGKQQFNQFTKTGEYIKNTDLPYAAAPISTGAIKDPDCMKGTISKWGDQFAKFGGAKKKKSVPKKKKSVPKKKKRSKK